MVNRYNILILVATLSLAIANAQEQDSVTINVAKEASRPVPVNSIHALGSPIVVDTLPTDNEALSIVLFNDNTWRYVRNRTIESDSTVYAKYWDTENISAYKDVSLSSLPKSVVIPLVDSTHNYHYPYIGRITSRYGPRWHRNHNGTDIALKSIGDTIYAAFDGRVRFAKSTNTGYGGLVIIRHDNGLETYMGHLSKRLVEANDRVVAGQAVALAGNSGRTTGPHVHFECRYYGQSFDPERLFDFKTGDLRRETFLLRRSYFDIYSKYDQNFDDEAEMDQADKRENAELAERRYYVVRKGDSLSRIAQRNHTTVSRLCSLNGIKANAVLQVGKRLRIK